MQACCGIVNINTSARTCNNFTSLDVYFFSLMERWWLCAMCYVKFEICLSRLTVDLGLWLGVRLFGDL